METIASNLRSTTPQSQRAQNVRRADPIRILIDKDRLARFWFLAVIVVLVGAGVERIHLARTLKERERVVIVDPAGTFFVSPLLQFQEAKQLHAEQSTLAAVAFLERNPKGFDHPELLKQMFLKHAQEKAHGEWTSEESEFKAQQLHQKAEIGKIDILQTRSDAVLTQVSGQRIHSCICTDHALSEALPFVLQIKMLQTPSK